MSPSPPTRSAVRRGNDVLPHAAVLVQRRPDGPVVALRAAGGEKQLLGLAAQRSGDGFPATVRQGFGLPAQGVLGGGVAVSFRKDLHHCLSGGYFQESGDYQIAPEASAAFDKGFPPKEKVSGLPSQERFQWIIQQTKPRL